MPTADRRKFLPRAIACYLAQDWPDKELIVVDDGKDRVEDLFASVPGAVYVYSKQSGLPKHRVNTPIGVKRNLACELASGQFIAHWDDDDWSAPNRLTDQVNRLLESGRSVTGYNQLLFWNAETRMLYRYTNGSSTYGCGTSLCYSRGYWLTNRFQATSYGEDTDFSSRARRDGAIIGCPANGLMVATIHGANSCQRDVSSSLYEMVDAEIMPEGFRACASI